jgi:hypothetical protein
MLTRKQRAEGTLKDATRNANTPSRRPPSRPTSNAELLRRRKRNIDLKVFDVIELSSSDSEEENRTVGTAAAARAQEQLKRLQKVCRDSARFPTHVDNLFFLKEIDVHKSNLADARSETVQLLNTGT